MLFPGSGCELVVDKPVAGGVVGNAEQSLRQGHQDNAFFRREVVFMEQSGDRNDRVFTVGVFEQDFLLGMGKASSIKEAGRLAAHEALEILRVQIIDDSIDKDVSLTYLPPVEDEGLAQQSD